MNIRIIQMNLLNFKGVRSLQINFGDVTNISGDNATGKTSVFDAFTWLMFGKNSDDAKDFNIKTLDKFNQPIHRLEHEVNAKLEYDGREIAFRKVYREKWTKKRGEAHEEFTGHETLYFVDDVPVQQKDYQSKVDMLMNESIAKMITSPTYFNSLKWQDRRQTLELMAGTISNEEVIANHPELRELLAQLGNDKLSELKKKIAAKKKLLKESLETIPTRIDELQRGLPEVLNWEEIALKITGLQTEIAGIETAIENKTAAFDLEYRKIQEKQKEKHGLEMQLLTEKQKGSTQKKIKLTELQGMATSLSREIEEEKRAIARNNETIKSNQQRIDSLTARNAKLREEWNTENAKVLTIDEHALNCPTCKQSLPEGDQTNIREKLTTNFNASKKAALDNNVKEGTSNAAAITGMKSEIETLSAANQLHQYKITATEAKLKSYNEDIEAVKLWPEGESKEAAEIQKQIDAFVIPDSPAIDNTELKTQKAALQCQVTELNTTLATKDQIAKAEARIKELEEEQLKQNQELADLERTEFSIEKFSKLKIETIEQRTNGKFKIVKFKMFQTNINGGVEECCECMVNGVPYSDVNTAGKIQAGIDIINALTEHYHINAPVFIDNRESIVTLPECKSQIVNLRVVEECPLMINGQISPWQTEAGKAVMKEWEERNTATA